MKIQEFQEKRGNHDYAYFIKHGKKFKGYEHVINQEIQKMSYIQKNDYDLLVAPIFILAASALVLMKLL